MALLLLFIGKTLHFMLILKTLTSVGNKILRFVNYSHCYLFMHNFVVISAQRPTMNTIQTIAFPPPEVQPMNITAPSIEISEDAVRFIFNEQGG